MSPVFESPSGLVSEVVYQTLPPWVTPWWGVGGTRLTYGRIPCVVSVLKPTYLYLYVQVYAVAAIEDHCLVLSFGSLAV